MRVYLRNILAELDRPCRNFPIGTSNGIGHILMQTLETIDTLFGKVPVIGAQLYLKIFMNRLDSNKQVLHRR